MNRLRFLIVILSLPLYSIAQTISGNVRDIEGTALRGVTVGMSGRHNETMTDSLGYYRIVVDDLKGQLYFTAADMERMVISIAGRTQLDVYMRAKVNNLDEVRVIGYGTTTQRNSVGSVARISAEEIANQPVSNPLLALQGRVAGLSVSATSGLPGATVKIQLRGQNTMNPNLAQNDPFDTPLFIIDGVPFAPQNSNINQFLSAVSPNSADNPYGGISPFNNIPPESIESIEVLRDADATAIYGSRGGNGVILITTKKGLPGKTRVGANVRSGFSFVGPTMPMMNTQEYLEMRREVYINDGIDPTLSPSSSAFAADLLVFDSAAYTDWKRYFLGNTANNTNINTTISGGSASTRFMIASNYSNETFIYPGNFNSSRIGFQGNVNHKSADDRFSVNVSSFFTSNNNNVPGSPDIIDAHKRMPNYPNPINQNGDLVWEFNGLPFNAILNNPVAYLRHLYQLGSTTLNSHAEINLRPHKNLIFKTALGYNLTIIDEYKGLPEEAQNPSNFRRRSATFGRGESNGWIVEPQFHYSSKFGKLQLSALIGASIQSNNSSSIAINASEYTSDALIKSISAAAETTASDNYNQYRYSAVFGRLNAIWDGKYILNGNIRRDGSSRFGPGQRFGNFGSVAAGWIFTEERWTNERIPTLSFGKLRASWGVTGSDATSPYQYISRWSLTGFPYNGTVGYQPANLFNPDLGWASTQKLEVGLELGFLRDRIMLTSAWFQNLTGNQLISYDLPSQTGFNNIAMNLNAVVQNSGWEFTLNAGLIRKELFSWTSNFNLSIPNNRLMAFDGLESSAYATRYVIGQPLSIVHGFEYEGVDKETGFFNFKNVNGEKTQQPVLPQGGIMNDFVPISTPDPILYGGVGNTFSFKGLALNVFFEFRKQNGRNYLAQVYSSVVGRQYNLPKTFVDRWRKPGDESNFQRVTTQGGSSTTASSFVRSSGVYSDASYIRLKNVSLSYNLPSHFYQKLFMDNVSVSCSAQNLLTFDNYLGNDPETQSFYAVPPLKTITFSLQMSF